MAFTALLGLMAAGTMVSAAGQIQAGRSAQAMADYNAQVDRNNATAAKQSAKYDADRMRENTRKLLSTQRARFAKGGVAFEGTPLLVMEQTARDAAMDASAIEYEGAVKAGGYESAATMSQYEGRTARQASTTRAFSTLLTGGAQVLGQSGYANRQPTIAR